MRFLAGLLAGALAVVPVETETVVYETIIVYEARAERTFADALQVETPIIDSMISDEEWQRIDAESDCLFEWLQQQVGFEITLERVLAASLWLEALGGACEQVGR